MVSSVSARDVFRGGFVANLPEVHVNQFHEWIANAAARFDSRLFVAQLGDVVEAKPQSNQFWTT